MIETLLLACAIGFGHAFEADHLVAVSSIVTKRNSTILAIKDGIYWGLGHTSIILVAGLIYLFGKLVLNEDIFRYFEAVVGIMLIILGATRLYKLIRFTDIAYTHVHEGSHKIAFGIGAIHGLAGSGAILLTVLAQNKSNFNGILYILVFGFGSVLGMMVASGIFSIPFSVRYLKNKWFGKVLSILSAVVCIILGYMIVYKNLH